ncbi:MAG: methionyl-tRNA formyltransferase [Chitinophagaceae bacterium]|nr:MAG: methionyl-tRNA formyltransferase [Chitinophagaceae bacterium]
MLKIIFFGTPEFAVTTLDKIHTSGHDVCAVVTTPDKPAGRGKKIQMSPVKKYAGEKNIAVLQPENLKDEQFTNALKKFEADLFVVVAFRKLPKTVWSLPPKGTINLHASLLPDYRGAAPINHVILNGESKSGVTTFFINDKIDTGDILLKKEVALTAKETAGTLHDKLMHLGADLLIETISGIENQSLKASSQKEVDSIKKAPKIFRDDCKINWSDDIINIERKIRGLSPYPGAFTYFSGKVLKIYAADLQTENHDFPYGTALTEGGELKVYGNGGILFIKELQPEGKKRMDIKSWLAGNRFEGKVAFE